MSNADIAGLILPVVAIALVMTFRRCIWLRRIVVFLAWFGVVGVSVCSPGLAARSAVPPSGEIWEQEVAFYDAWQQGVLAAQKYVRGCLLHLVVWCSTLAILALVPALTECKDSKQEDRGTKTEEPSI